MNIGQGMPQLPPSAATSSVSNYGASLPPAEFAKEIDYNIKILCQSAQNGNISDTDIAEFRKIFEADVKTLQNKDPNLAETIRGELTDFDQIKVVFNPQASSNLKLVGQQKSLQSYAQHHNYPADSLLSRGAHSLSSSLDIIPIKGDGHCLFRSIGVGLANQFLAMNIGERATYLNALEESLKKYQDPERTALAASFKTIRQHLVDLADPSKNRTIEQLFNNQGQSDDFVRFLRQLACAYNRTNRHADLDVIVPGLGLGWKNADTYLNAVADIDQAKYGEDVEASALAEALKLKINVHNVQSHGKADKRGATNTFGPNTKREIDLLFFPLHYALGIKNKPKTLP